MLDDKVKPIKTVKELLELHLVMDYMALVDKCQNGDHSITFALRVLPPIGKKIEASLHDPELVKIMEVLLPKRGK